MVETTFSPATRRALGAAQAEAIRLGQPYVGPEHMLLGLLGERAAVVLLEEAGGSPIGIRNRVEEIMRRKAAGSKAKRPGAGDTLPYTSFSKLLLESAMAEARRHGDTVVEPGHLLLALFAARTGNVAGFVLRGAGVDAAVVEGELRGAERAAAEAPPVWFLELDPDADAPIYEQIIAGVEEAVATGRLEPGERMPTVRDLAQELGTAPGTVARAYSELEKRGVLETGGARGTFVAERTEVADAPGEHLEGLLRPVAIAAFHLGATADQLRAALERAMNGILPA